MGAGKSSVVAHLKETNDEMFANDPVVVEADAFKHLDPVFHALKAFQEKNVSSTSNGSSNGKNNNNGGEPRVSQLVHAHSTDAANQQLVVALANQRDVVVDGTMTWMPYVQQTIEMVRNAHKHKYLLGPGYSEENEQYWEKAEAIDDEDRLFLPYRVEMVGVTVDPEHAVSRGIRRAIITGRGVPVQGQLRSHRLYSEHFPTYANENESNEINENESTDHDKGLFDRIRLFDNSSAGRVDSSPEKDNSGSPSSNEMEKNIDATDDAGSASGKEKRRPPPRCVAWKHSPDLPLSVVPDAYQQFLRKRRVNDAATGVADLYKNNDGGDDDDNEMNNIEIGKPPQPSTIDAIMIHWRLREAFTIERGH